MDTSRKYSMLRMQNAGVYFLSARQGTARKNLR
nr:MAG TPA: hypothetical protein [Caudoviricetes sp.]